MTRSAGLIVLLFGIFVGLLAGITVASLIAYRVHAADLSGYARTGHMAVKGEIYYVLPAGMRDICVSEVR